MPLTDRAIRRAKPGKHSDGRGLILRVSPSLSKYWYVRYQRNGRRREMGLGPYPIISLSEARTAAFEAKKQLVAGLDPLEEKRLSKGKDFRSIAGQLIEQMRPGWKNPIHAKQWPSSLEMYVYPLIGHLPINEITSDQIVALMKPIWTKKTETARRTLNRVSKVFEFAEASGVFRGDNPARWKGKLEHLLPPPNKIAKVTHHAALPWKDAPAFMKQLGEVQGQGARALEFLILTASRTGEVLKMRTEELDLEAKTWTIPADRMKAGKEHVVPLNGRALELVANEADQSGFVFRSTRKQDQPLSNMAMLKVLKAMGRNDLTVHGFRSTFRDWAGEATDYPREVIEMSLAHQLKDKTEAAYARGNLLEKRRLLLSAWSEFFLNQNI